MTAKTKDGKEVFTDSKIYIPGSPAYGRGDKMVYGPFRKSGMLVDSSLAPGHVNAKEEKFSIPFPHDVVEKEGKKVREIKAKEMDVTIKLWYMPAGGDHKKGMVGKDQFLVYETTKTVSIK